ncbi:MAG: hypothetical protein DRH37_01860 [Deltaproteobacteria bacterium]|nr:MAG: hypothetical protein DRH37_01860 [Deltaproteobacteria bacterium]
MVLTAGKHKEKTKTKQGKFYPFASTAFPRRVRSILIHCRFGISYRKACSLSIRDFPGHQGMAGASHPHESD